MSANYNDDGDGSESLTQQKILGEVRTLVVENLDGSHSTTNAFVESGTHKIFSFEKPKDSPFIGELGSLIEIDANVSSKHIIKQYEIKNRISVDSMKNSRSNAKALKSNASSKSILVVAINYKGTTSTQYGSCNKDQAKNIVTGATGLNPFLKSMTKSSVDYFDIDRSLFIDLSVDKSWTEITGPICNYLDDGAVIRNTVLEELRKMNINVNDYDHNIFLHNGIMGCNAAAIGESPGTFVESYGCNEGIWLRRRFPCSHTDV